MKWPQHRTPEPPGRRGRAPYNFVPLPEAILEWEPFVDESLARGHDRLESQRHHGYFDLTITTETELYTRCAYSPEHEGKDSADPGADAKKIRTTPDRQRFFHHGDIARPVIPGSSLRGMVRSLVEILSYSRISRRIQGPDGPKAVRIRDEKLVYRAVADRTSVGQSYSERFLPRRSGALSVDYPHPLVRAGYLEPVQGANGRWEIRPAEVHPRPPAPDGSPFVRVPLGKIPPGLACPPAKASPGGKAPSIPTRDVWVAPKPIAAQSPGKGKGLTLWYAKTDVIQDKPAPGLVAGRLVCTGDTPKRTMHTVVYAPDPLAALVPIPPSMWALYEEDRDMRRGLPCRAIRSAGDPVFYLLDAAGKLVFFGPTPFFRVPYTRATGDFVPPATMGDESAPLDMAEAIFGTVNGERQSGKPATGAHRGRVFFEDAGWDGLGDPPFLDGEESESKPEAHNRRYPSILSSPKPTSYQNYLVQMDPGGSPRALLSYDAKTPQDTVLRGFKRYWHRGSAQQDLHLQIPPPLDPTKDASESQYTAVRPVRKEVTFKGRVRFENLDDIELGALVTAMRLPDSCRHKLGMGKPFGMGSVKIQAELSLFSPREKYRSLASTGLQATESAEGIRDRAEAAFALRVLGHYAAHAEKPKVAGVVWEIPRLAELRSLLEWAEGKRPERSATAYLPDPKLFKERQTLPTPGFLARRADPALVANVPGGAVQEPAPPAPASATTAPPPAAATRRAAKGVIVRFGQYQVRLRVDGEPADRLVRLDTRVFPMDAWATLSATNLPPGKRIAIEMSDEAVVRVVPE